MICSGVGTRLARITKDRFLYLLEWSKNRQYEIELLPVGKSCRRCKGFANSVDCFPRAATSGEAEVLANTLEAFKRKNRPADAIVVFERVRISIFDIGDSSEAHVPKNQ